MHLKVREQDIFYFDIYKSLNDIIIRTSLETVIFMAFICAMVHISNRKENGYTGNNMKREFVEF